MNSAFCHLVIGYCSQIYPCFAIWSLDTASRYISVFPSDHWIQHPDLSVFSHWILHPDLSVFLHQIIGYSTQIYGCFRTRSLDTEPRSSVLNHIIGYITQIYRCFCIRSLDTAPRSIGVFAPDHWIQHPDLSVFSHQIIGYCIRSRTYWSLLQ